MAVLKGLFSLLVILLIVVSVLFVDFVYKTFSLTQRDVQAEAIVVLTGGLGRVEEGIKLYRQGKGRQLFLIGVDPSVKKRELYRGPGAENVFLENVSRNTLENAIYGRDLIMKHKVRSIKLITSRYHMKRATLIFRHALPKDVAIYPHPVDTKNLKEKWWKHEGSFRLLFSEFYKYCGFRLFFLFAPGELRAPTLIGVTSGASSVIGGWDRNRTTSLAAAAVAASPSPCPPPARGGGTEHELLAPRRTLA